MMRRRFGPSRRPPWWPDNEPWPSHRYRRDRMTRLRFFRRFALLAAVLLTSAVFGMVTLAWHAAATLGITTSSRPGIAPMLLVMAGSVGAVAAVAAVGALLRRIGVPLAATMEAADRVAAGDYSTRVDERGPVPIRALARSFNTMTERLQNHDRMRRDLMADVAHELRTPLTVIQGKLEGLIDGVYPRDDQQLQQLLEETHVLSRLVEDLRTLALSESGALELQREPADLAGLARDAVAAFAAGATGRKVELRVDVPSDLAPIEVDPVRIREVLGNLLANALRHTPAGGTITLRVAAEGAGALSVDVRDTGSGMTPDQLAHAFDRFYKGSRSHGSGLGLTIAKNLVAAHGGTIRASSEPGLGTTVAFTLPRKP